MPFTYLLLVSNSLGKEIEKIKERNKRMEADKAWETSFTRRALISVATYIVISSFLLFQGSLILG